MKKILLFICLSLAACQAFAQPNAKIRPNETVLLYGTEMVDNVDLVVGKAVTPAGFEMVESNGLTGPEELAKSGNLGNISVNARFDLYFPKKPNGQMVIVCPGGGYKYVSSYNEGVYVADWMVSKGITVAIMKYRMPNGHWEVPLADVQNAFRYCRAHAAEWGVDQIGVMGFSAGGHLAASATNLFTDDVTRPDFSVLVYPVISMEDGITHNGTKKYLLGNEETWNDKSKTVTTWEADMKEYCRILNKYTIEAQISDRTPASFIIHCTDDSTVPVENTIRYYRNLVKHNVPAEVHIFPSGNHGWGFSAEKYVGKGNDRFAYGRAEFLESLERWLKNVK